MNVPYFSIAIGVIVAAAIFIRARASSREVKSQEVAKAKETGTVITDKLEALSYFKYAAPSDIPSMKSAMAESFEKYGVLSGTEDDSTYLPKDYRLYFCDGEDLFEQGGLVEALARVKHTFLKAGLTLEWSDETDDQDGDNWDHRIKLNGKEYIAFKGDMSPMDVWGVAAKNFALMLNDQLSLQGSDEQVHLISGGNEGSLVFLTSEQYSYLRQVLPDVEHNPLSVDEWCKRNQVSR